MSKYRQSKKAVEVLCFSTGKAGEGKEGKEEEEDGMQDRGSHEVMVPLTTSMYIPAKVRATDKVTVELGCGFYVKKPVPRALEFLDRKIKYVEKNIEVLEKNIMQRRNSLESVLAMTNLRVKEQTQQPVQTQKES